MVKVRKNYYYKTINNGCRSFLMTSQRMEKLEKYIHSLYLYSTLPEIFDQEKQEKSRTTACHRSRAWLLHATCFLYSWRQSKRNWNSSEIFMKKFLEMILRKETFHKAKFPLSSIANRWTALCNLFSCLYSFFAILLQSFRLSSFALYII